MLYNVYNQYFIDILTLFDLRIKCFLCLCLWVLCTRRVCKFPLGSPQILICGESESIRVTSHKTEFCGVYEDSSREEACLQVGFSSNLSKKQSFKSTQRVYLCFCSKINASLLLKIKQKRPA